MRLAGAVAALCWRFLEHQKPLPVGGDIVVCARYSPSGIVKNPSLINRLASWPPTRSPVPTPTRMIARQGRRRTARRPHAPRAAAYRRSWTPASGRCSTSGNGRTETSNPPPESFASYASQRPSGEMTPFRSAKRVSAPAASRNARRPTASSMMSSVVVGDASVKISRRPSRDTAVAYCGWDRRSVVRTAPVPSAALTEEIPGRRTDLERENQRRPSGIHSGLPSLPGIGRHARERRSSQIPDPDVALLIDRPHRDACPVWRQARDTDTHAAAPGSASRAPGDPPTPAYAANCSGPAVPATYAKVPSPATTANDAAGGGRHHLRHDRDGGPTSPNGSGRMPPPAGCRPPRRPDGRSARSGRDCPRWTRILRVPVREVENGHLRSIGAAGRVP